jgi:hypothetical protein
MNVCVYIHIQAEKWCVSSENMCICIYVFINVCVYIHAYTQTSAFDEKNQR